MLYDPAWDEKGSGVNFLFKSFSALTHNSSLPGESTTRPTAEPFKNNHHHRAPNFLRLIPGVLKVTWFL
jgi:hypothetical protein